VSATTVVANAGQGLSDVGSNGSGAITANNNSTDASQNMTKNFTAVEETQSFAFGTDMQIRDALDILAAKYEKNIVSSPKIEGQLACKKLFDVTFEEAVEAILGTDFKYRQEGNLIKVYTAAEYNNIKRDKSLMTYKVFTLYYITAAEASELVSSILSEDGNIKITAAAATGVPTNQSIGPQSGGGNTTAMSDTLVVYDYPENIEKVEQILASIDIRPKQILIEATILSATLTEGMQFGIDWQTLTTVIDDLTDITRGASDYFKSAGTSANVGSSSLTGGMTIGFVHDDVAGFIRAVEEVTDVTILANPKILAVNKQLGQVFIGKKIAYQSQTTQTQTSTTEQVEFIDTGTKLSFRPFICNDGYIRMDIHPKDSSATLRVSGDVTLPDETSAELVTNILVKDGQTIVIGGLFRNKITTTKTQVPILGDLPIIGALFRGTADEVRREEVIVLLTPHIITEANQTHQWAGPQDVQRKILGAKKELQWINKVRRVNDYYENAAEYYIDGDYEAAMKELNLAIELYPAYLEAIRLKEKIMRESSLKKLKMNY
jgi:type II secretory pathway component GspD/PulD (secretin)